jgi:hypothetical protein
MGRSGIQRPFVLQLNLLRPETVVINYITTLLRGFRDRNEKDREIE